jgi:hypothetical protein
VRFAVRKFFTAKDAKFALLENSLQFFRRPDLNCVSARLREDSFYFRGISSTRCTSAKNSFKLIGFV